MEYKQQGASGSLETIRLDQDHPELTSFFRTVTLDETTPRDPVEIQ